MKKLLFAALLATGLSASAFAAPTVKTSAATQFAQDFKTATNVSWKSTPDFIKVSFTLNKEKREAYYETDGTMIALSKSIPTEALPDNVQNALKTHYADYTVQDRILMEGTDESAYYISLSKNGESMILKADDTGYISTWSKTKTPSSLKGK